jgi:hypothetical protein
VSRLFTPALLLATAAGVAVYNTSANGRVMVFPFMDRIAADPAAQGWWTVGLLTVLGLVALGAALRGLARERETE